jgi:two-component system sensor histidine kinase ChiS
MKVLIVEDDTASRIVLEKHLRDWGYEVISAPTGYEAWQIIRDQQPEIVLADWVMPGMDGLELCKKVRSQQNSRYTYIIFLTSKRESEDMITALDAGADDYLSKPLDRDILKSRMAVGARTINYENELEVTYKKLMETAHRAGMAEVAANVLHNVGNALNSINVSAAIVAETIKNSETDNLVKLADLITEHKSDMANFLTQDAKGRYIPTYICEVSKHLAQQQTETVEKLQAIIKNVDHVKEIVKMQHLYAAAESHLDTVSLDELIENAVEINYSGLIRQKIEVIREYEDIGNIVIDKQKTLQILVNLIDNAEHSLSQSSNEPKLLRIRTAKSNDERVRIEVIDNGIGIDPANLEKIFERGFTTKQSGHGFGLNNCQLAVKGMQGSLTVQSPGLNQGATFIFEMPLKKAEVQSGKSK